MPSERVLVDGRFINASGIGRHIRGVLSHWPAAPASIVVPNVDAAPSGWTPVVAGAGMYSLAEQGAGFRRSLRGADTVWFPHFSHPLRQRGRWVCTVHDVIQLVMPELFPSRIKRAAARALLVDIRDRAAAVAFVSAFSRDEFIRVIGHPRGSIEIVGNGVDARWFEPADELADVPSRPYIVAVGNVKAHKGLAALVAAMHDPRLADFDLVLIGQRDGLRHIDHATQAQAEALGERCHWTGWVDDEHLRSWVGHAQVLVFPSLYEGFGLPPLEAMASGVPVVASAIPPLKEVTHGRFTDAASWFEPGSSDALAEQLVALLGSPSRQAAQVSLGRECARWWHWGQTAAATHRLIESG